MGDHSNVRIRGDNPTAGDTWDSLEAPQSEQVVAVSNDEDAAHLWNLSPRSTLSCNAVERQAVEDGNWTSLQKNEDVVIKSSTGFTLYDSFRSEDNEVLALWEEKEKSPNAVSTDLSWLKAAPGSQSPWLGAVSNAVKKMEILSHAWARISPVDSRPSTLDCSGPPLEYLKRVSGRSTWKDFKIVSLPVRSSETVLHISSKVRYSNKSPSRRPDGTELPFSGPISGTPPDSESSSKLRHSVSCELLIGSSQAVNLNKSRQADDESEPSLRSDSNHGKVVDALQTISAAAKRAISRKTGAEAVASVKERYSASRRSHSMNDAMLIDCGSEQAREGNLHLEETRIPKASHRYYERVMSRRKKSSCWNSFDDTHLDHTIDFVAPSAARFLEDEGSVSPVRTPIKRPGAVPFKWEKEPGKPKESDSDSAATMSGPLNIALPLPPRLAVGHCPSVSSTSSHYQCSSPLRSPCCSNATMSGSLREHYALPSSRYPSMESQKVLLPWFSSSFGKTSYHLSSASSEPLERDPCTSSATELPMRKSKSVGEVRSVPQSFSRLPIGGGARDRGIAQKPCNSMARQPDQQKSAHPSGVVRPPSPTSILCGPDAGNRSSSNDPSLSSERHEASRISVMAASPLSQSSLPALISFDSIERRIDNSSELLIPCSSLTSPFRTTFRSSSASYNPDFEEMRKYLNITEYQMGAAHSESAFVKFCKTGKRWMKIKSHAKLGTNLSPEVWTPSFVIEHDANLDFSARLGEGSSHSQVQTEGYFVPSASAAPQEDLGNRSPTYAATLGLLTSVQKLSSEKTKNRQTKPPPRTTWKSTRRLRTRARLRARFLNSANFVDKVYISPWKHKRESGRTKAAVPTPFTPPFTLANSISSFAS